MFGTIVVIVGFGLMMGVPVSLITGIWVHDTAWRMSTKRRCVSLRYVLTVAGAGLATVALFGSGMAWALASENPKVPDDVLVTERLAVVLGSDECDRDTGDLDDPVQIRNAVEWLSVRACAWVAVSDGSVRTLDCTGIEGALKGTPSYYRHTVRRPWRTGNHGPSVRFLYAVNNAAYSECRQQAAIHAYESLGAQMPESFSKNMLIETWVELCGAGQRSSSRRGFLSSSQSASSTDNLLVDALVADGHNWVDASNAVFDGYRKNSINCPAEDPVS